MEIKRRELKYYINYSDYLVLASRLQQFLTRDKNSSPSDYLVRSVYFDDLEDSAFHEKMAGVKNRKKYRVRIYDPTSSKARLEIKHKRNNLIYKEGGWIAKQDAIALIDKKYSVLRKYNFPAAQQVYAAFSRSAYAPVVTVDYDREAFVSSLSNLRITFDKQLRVDTTSYDLFDPNLRTTHCMYGRLILEVKYDHPLPSWFLRILQLPRFERSAISKYCLGRKALK